MPTSDRDPTIHLRDQERIKVIRERTREHIAVLNEVQIRTVRRLTPEVDEEMAQIVVDRELASNPPR